MALRPASPKTIFRKHLGRRLCRLAASGRPRWHGHPAQVGRSGTDSGDKPVPLPARFDSRRRSGQPDVLLGQPELASNLALLHRSTARSEQPHSTLRPCPLSLPSNSA
jgi:hypothetical protein